MTEAGPVETAPPTVAGRVRLCVLGMSERSFEALRLLVELNQPGRLEIAAPADADVAVIDLDGLEGPRLLATHRKRYPDCPVVGVSLHPEQGEQVDGFVAKPLRLDKLTSVVTGVVAVARDRRSAPEEQPGTAAGQAPAEAPGAGQQPERAGPWQPAASGRASSPPAPVGQPGQVERRSAAVAQQPVEPQRLAAQQQRAAAAERQASRPRQTREQPEPVQESPPAGRTNGVAPDAGPPVEPPQLTQPAQPAQPGPVDRAALPGAPPDPGSPLVVWTPTRNTDRSPNRAARGVEARSAGERMDTPRILGLLSPTADSGDGSFLALIFKAIDKAHTRERPVELRSPAGWIVLDVQRGMVSTDLGKRQLYRLARVSAQTWQWSSRVRRAGLRGDPSEWISVEALLWQLAVWTHGSTLPPGISPEAPVALWRWPDLTRNAPLDHAVRIAARWVVQPTSLAETVRVLGATTAQVNTFFVAAWAAGLIVLPPPQQQPPNESDGASTSAGGGAKRGAPDRSAGPAHRSGRPIGATPRPLSRARRRVLGDLLGRLRDR